MAVPHFGHFFCVQGAPRSCGSRCPHCGHRQVPAGPPARGPPMRPYHFHLDLVPVRRPAPWGLFRLLLALSSPPFLKIFLLFHCPSPPPGPFRRVVFHSGELVLSGTAHSSAMAPPATAATGHGKGVALQVASEPGLDDLAQVAGDERDHPDAICGDHLMERPGDRAANQRTDAKLHQAKRLLYRQIIRQDFPRFCDDASRGRPRRRESAVRCRTPARSDRPSMQMRFSSSEVLRLLSSLHR